MNECPSSVHIEQWVCFCLPSKSYSLTHKSFGEDLRGEQGCFCCVASSHLKAVLIRGQQTLHCEKLLSPKPWCQLGLHVPSCPLLTDGKEPKPSICSSVPWEGTGARTDLAGAAVTVGVSQAVSLSLGYLAPDEALAI